MISTRADIFVFVHRWIISIYNSCLMKECICRILHCRVLFQFWLLMRIACVLLGWHVYRKMLPSGISLNYTVFWFANNKELIAIAVFFFFLISFTKFVLYNSKLMQVPRNIRMMYTFSILKMKLVTESCFLFLSLFYLKKDFWDLIHCLNLHLEKSNSSRSHDLPAYYILGPVIGFRNMKMILTLFLPWRNFHSCR